VPSDELQAILEYGKDIPGIRRNIDQLKRDLDELKSDGKVITAAVTDLHCFIRPLFHNRRPGYARRFTIVYAVI
jgi:hypothetical protein